MPTTAEIIISMWVTTGKTDRQMLDIRGTLGNVAAVLRLNKKWTTLSQRMM